jgi:hypothetical protein
MNEVGDKFEEFSDSITAKLPTLDNNNSSDLQKEIYSYDPFGDYFGLAKYSGF